MNDATTMLIAELNGCIRKEEHNILRAQAELSRVTSIRMQLLDALRGHDEQHTVAKSVDVDEMLARMHRLVCLAETLGHPIISDDMRILQCEVAALIRANARASNTGR